MYWMALHSKSYSVYLLGILLALSGSELQAGTIDSAQGEIIEKVYFSIFGGGGVSNQVNIGQYGTAFFIEAENGPLAINASGQASTRNARLFGGHIGYQWRDVVLNSFNRQANMSSAIELEGYYLAKSSLSGHDINNDVTRPIESDFLVTYPMSTGIFLANTLLNFNWAHYDKWHLYVGAGIGAALISISQAESLQMAPLEADVNHYSGNPNDTIATFAAQTKVGLNFAISEHLSLFAEYRWLYIADSNYTFGSTVYPTHVATSTWNVNLGSQDYNMGVGGIRLII
ncbi:MAG: hypothetical protein CK424_04115 [Legionella sp.]|nr:MAG: hypothetical protein CK424_04115 [Legionella sp.]